jgi:hypothetical protein
LDCLGIGGEDYVRRLRIGWPVVGVADESGIWDYKPGAQHVKRPIQSKRDLLAQREALIKDFEEIAKSQSQEEKELVWESFIKECREGTLDGYFPLTDTHRFPPEFLPLRRFVIEKMTSKLIDGRYQGVLKRRPCDNAKRSGLNKSFFSRHRVRLPTQDTTSVVAQDLMG